MKTENIQYLDGSKRIVMKKFIPILLIVLSQSCFHKEIKSSEQKLKTTELNSQSDSLIIKTIKDFYVSYIIENSKEEFDESVVNEIKRKYVTENLLLSIKTKMSDGSLDWDPFVNAQDFYEGWINSLNITKELSKDNIYKVSYFDGNNDVEIFISLITEDNQFKIDFIDDTVISNVVEEKSEECIVNQLINGKTIRIIKPSIDNSLILKIEIVSDNSNTISQVIDYEPFSFSGHCNSILYYNGISIHNDYQIVVGDYNFDSLDDFAILYDNTINTGNIFTYFFQDANGKFAEDEEFPLKLIPVKIGISDKTLEQVNIVGCCSSTSTIYQLVNSKWILKLTKTESIE